MEPRPRLRPVVRRRPETATLLSFLLPGLGQWYGGRPRAGLVFAVPIAVLLGVVAAVALDGPERLALRLFEPGVALGIAIVAIVAGAWRLASMVHAGPAVAGRAAFRGRALGVLAVLGAVTIAAHGAVVAVAWGFHTAGERIFVADPVPDPADPGRTPSPAETPGPTATPRPLDQRVNILLTGIDSGSGRDHALTDTLIVVSIDPVTRDVAMISFPRDIARFPLWDGRTYTGKINSLMSYARAHPDEFPDGPMASLTRELGYLLGIPVDYYAAVNLAGFQRMIDAVGGVTIVNERLIDDPAYAGWADGRVGFRLAAGRHTLDGPTALAYVRSRKGVGDNDFTRARRQQQVLVALRDRLTDPAVLPRLPAILDAAADTVSTNFPRDRLTEMLELGRAVDDDRIEQVVLGPPYSTHPPMSTTGGIYILVLDLDRVAALSVKLFGEASRYAEAGGSS